MAEWLLVDAWPTGVAITHSVSVKAYHNMLFDQRSSGIQGSHTPFARFAIHPSGILLLVLHSPASSCVICVHKIFAHNQFVCNIRGSACASSSVNAST